MTNHHPDNDPNSEDHTPSLGGERRIVPADEAPMLGGQTAWEHLETSLQDPRWHVRRRAVRLLGHQPDRKALDTLIEALADVDKRVRETAIQTLAGLEDDRVTPLLLEALHARSYVLRAAAAQALASRADPAAAPGLANALRGDDGNLRLHAASALMRIGEPAVRHIEPVLQHSQWRVRLAAATVLDQILRDSDDPYLSPARFALHAALSDRHHEVRFFAAQVLGEAEDRAAIPVLLDMLAADDPLARVDAARLLGDFRENRATPLLIELLDDNRRGWEHTVAHAAAGALSRIGSAEAMAALERWRQDNDLRPNLDPDGV